ncbi:hypothetical protein E0500_010805 [Streptomyces sp. KM273126]|uniref:hypothetical protein n=1 Tax=Streptomyces sp. KM273126 TaxID=2545247 RepID=UPI00103AE22A|nr:hypothetical protein [Streptomyces sp. KM273126]MBA2807887.1 hypothetical protein [Streptomyces sp. KM273126]
MNNDLRSRLAELDAAPRREPSAADIDREERLLRTVLSDTGRPERSAGAVFRRPLVRRLAFTAAGGVLAAGAAVVAVTAGGLFGIGGSGPLSSAELASWTSTPHSLNTDSGEGSKVEKQCLEFTKDFGDAGSRPEISNAEIRGSVGSMIITRAGDATYCLMGSDGSGIGMAVSDVAKLPADQIDLDTYGSRGEGSGLLNYALGSAGSDVKEITLQDRGKTIHALVQDGRWTAWWPKGHPEGLITGTFTLTLKDGTTRTVEGDAL